MKPTINHHDPQSVADRQRERELAKFAKGLRESTRQRERERDLAKNAKGLQVV